MAGPAGLLLKAAGTALNTAKNRERAVQVAKEYRQFWEENPKLGMALGFVPLVGQALGAADAAAATIDPDAGKLETGLAYAGMIPAGKILQAGKKLSITIGEKGAQRIRDAGLEHELVDLGRTAPLEGGGQTRLFEIADNVKLDPNFAGQNSLLASGGNRVSVQSVADADKTGLLTKAYPELAGTPISAKWGHDGAGTFRGATGEIELRSSRVPELDFGEKSHLYKEQQAQLAANRRKRDGAAVHEIEHAVQKAEGLAKKSHRGASASDIWGEMTPETIQKYQLNPGEIMAETDRMRAGWSLEKRRKIPYEVTRGAVTKYRMDAADAGTLVKDADFERYVNEFHALYE